MHIILGAIGSIVTLLWLLHRLAEMGIDLGGLNPWLWRRRRTWKNRYEANPVFAVESPMEVTALLIAATAKADGDMSSEEKTEMLAMFESEFRLSQQDAAALMTSTTHMLGTGEELRENLPAVLAPSKEKFSEELSMSAIKMINRIADVGGEATHVQKDFIDAVTELLAADSETKGKWQ